MNKNYPRYNLKSNTISLKYQSHIIKVVPPPFYEKKFKCEKVRINTLLQNGSRIKILSLNRTTKLV